MVGSSREQRVPLRHAAQQAARRFAQRRCARSPERNYAYPSHPELIKRFLTAQATDVSDSSAHCYDVIALALDAIGFTDLLALSMTQKSKELEQLYERELPDGYRYLPPVEIIPLQA